MCTSLGGIPMPTPQCSGNIAGRGHKNIRVRKWGELLWNPVLFTRHDYYIYELTENLVTYMRHTYAKSIKGSNSEAEGAPEAPWSTDKWRVVHN